MSFGLEALDLLTLPIAVKRIFILLFLRIGVLNIHFQLEVLPVLALLILLKLLIQLRALHTHQV